MITLLNLQRETGTDLSLTAMCRVLAVNRADYYRAHRPPLVRDETALPDAVQRIAREMPGYGSWRITAELRRQGRPINRKRVQRIMREDNLLCLRCSKFVRTTDSGHGLAAYPNLVPTLTVNGMNQLWVADITYIRLLREFVYLAVLLDAFSRRCIGWSLGRTLEAEVPLAALRMARETREAGAGLVHHSARRRAVRRGRLHGPARTARQRHQHEPPGQSL